MGENPATSTFPDPSISSLRHLPNTMAREVARRRKFVWWITKQVLCHVATLGSSTEASSHDCLRKNYALTRCFAHNDGHVWTQHAL